MGQLMHQNLVECVVRVLPHQNYVVCTFCLASVKHASIRTLSWKNTSPLLDFTEVIFDTLTVPQSIIKVIVT